MVSTYCWASLENTLNEDFECLNLDLHIWDLPKNDYHTSSSISIIMVKCKKYIFPVNTKVRVSLIYNGIYCIFPEFVCV